MSKPTIVPKAAKQADPIARARLIARITDSAFEIPGTGWRVGLDGIVGLIPGVGDLLGLLVSYFIILDAARYRVSVPILLRMIGNVAFDALAGSVPILGDLFDFVFHANERNVALFERHGRFADEPRSGADSRRRIGVSVVAIVVGSAIVIVLLGAALIAGLLSLFRS